MGITIKKLATDLNVTKPTVSKAIEMCGLSNRLTRIGNRFELTDDQAELIKSKILQTQSKIAKNAKKNEKENANKDIKQDKTTDETKNLIMQIMQSQIAKKDEQLSEKDKQLASLTAALAAAQEQNKQLTAALTAAQSLHAGTIQQQLIEAETVQDSAPVADTSETEAAAETETPVEPTKKASFRERLSFLLHGK